MACAVVVGTESASESILGVRVDRSVVVQYNPLSLDMGDSL